jgi:selenium metabolism protein YedF
MSQDPNSRTAVLLASEVLGQGEDELGRILMRSFLKTMLELDPLPWRLLLLNTGVKLAIEESDLIDDLRALAGRGVEILCCGTCLDYFHSKDLLQVGRISNMHEILSSLAGADQVLRP